jgi:pentapeptide MXKDX repeat protein
MGAPLLASFARVGNYLLAYYAWIKPALPCVPLCPLWLMFCVCNFPTPPHIPSQPAGETCRTIKLNTHLKEKTMKKFFGSFALACILMASMSAFTQDSMKQDSTSQDSSKQDTMKKDDSMKNDSMKDDSMKKDAKKAKKNKAAKKDTMKKDDSMKKDDTMKNDQMKQN